MKTASKVEAMVKESAETQIKGILAMYGQWAP
jgi:hypothetical protein